MSDLQLEVANTEVKQTTLIGAPGDLGPDKIKDFTGAHVLECIPHTSLLNSSVPTNNSAASSAAAWVEASACMACRPAAPV